MSRPKRRRNPRSLGRGGCQVPLAVAEQRDPKGLYKKARRGELKNFTGIDSCYEPPLLPEIQIDTAQISVSTAAEKVVNYLLNNQYLENHKSS